MKRLSQSFVRLDISEKCNTEELKKIACLFFWEKVKTINDKFDLEV